MEVKHHALVGRRMKRSAVVFQKSNKMRETDFLLLGVVGETEVL